MPKSLTYERARSKWNLWTWEADFRFSIEDWERYKEASQEKQRWYNCMMGFPAQNVLKTE